MKALFALTALVLSLSIAACPPFDDLDYPDAGTGGGEGEGEAGEGEGEGGEGEGEDACRAPAVDEPWQRIDIDIGTETEPGALASDGTRVFAALRDGRVYAIDGNVSTQLANCVDGPDGAQTFLGARRLFVLDDTLLVSGRGGFCLVDIATGDEEMVTIGDADVDVAAVPLDAAANTIVVVSANGASFRFELRARTGIVVGAATVLEGDAAPVETNELDAIATSRGALVSDEQGRVYFVDEALPSVARVAGFGADPPRGLILAAVPSRIDTAFIDVALRRAGALRLFRMPVAVLLSGDIAEATPVDDEFEIERSPSLFPYETDTVESVAVRVDGARLDVGPFGYATFYDGAVSPQPLGAQVRVANITAMATFDDSSPIWSASQSDADITYWERATVASGAWTTTVDAAGRPAAFGLRTILPLGGASAFITSGNGVVLATVVGDQIVFDVAQGMGNQAAGIDSIAGIAAAAADAAEAFVVANVAGDVFIVALANPTQPTAVTGTIDVDTPTTNLDLAIVGDPSRTTGDDVGLFAAGLFAGAPALRSCLVSLGDATITCDATAPLAMDATPPFEMSRLVSTSAGLVALSNRGVSIDRGSGFEAIAIPAAFFDDFEGDGTLETPFAGGGGDVVDLGDGCLALFGFSKETFALDASSGATSLALGELLSVDLNPFMSTAVRLSDEVIVGSGGLGNAFYEIDVAAAAGCEARFAAANVSVTLLPPDRPTRGPNRGTFIGCDIVVGDELGELWRMDLDR